MPGRIREEGASGEVATDVHFRTAAVAVGPSERLISSNLVMTGDGAVVLEAYTEEGRRSLLRVEDGDDGDVSAIVGFRGGSTGVRAGARLAHGDLLLVGEGAAYRVNLPERRAEHLAIRHLPRNISHVHALNDELLLVSPLFADTVAVLSVAEGAVIRQFRSPAHEVVRQEQADAWLVNGSRGWSARHRLGDFERISSHEFPTGATPVDDGAEVFSLPGTPFQTGGISRASFVQVQPSGRVQACRIDGTDRREGPGAPGLDQLVGIDGQGRLVGVAGSSVVLLDRSTLTPLARLPLLVRRLLSTTMVGPTALALLQPLPPLVHFISW
jgi:hypothetical protein